MLNCSRKRIVDKIIILLYAPFRRSQMFTKCFIIFVVLGFALTGLGLFDPLRFRIPGLIGIGLFLVALVMAVTKGADEILQ